MLKFETKHPYTEYYIRSAFGYMVLCTQEAFDFALVKIENELPGAYNEYVTGFGIQITKWMYEGKELLRMKDYEENYEEIDPMAEEDQRAINAYPQGYIREPEPKHDVSDGQMNITEWMIQEEEKV